MNLRDTIRVAVLVAFAAGFYSLSRIAGQVDELFAPVLTSVGLGLFVQSLVYVMSKIQFGASMTSLANEARKTATGSAIVFASIVAFMIALSVLFTGLLN